MIKFHLPVVLRGSSKKSCRTCGLRNTKKQLYSVLHFCLRPEVCFAQCAGLRFYFGSFGDKLHLFVVSVAIFWPFSVCLWY